MSQTMKITPFLAVQSGALLLLVALMVLRHGEWNAARWTGLIIAIPAAIMLFVARIQLGNSFAVTPQARELVTHGIYSKIRNPIYVFSAILVLGFLISLQIRYAFVFLIILIPIQMVRAHQEAKILEQKFGDAYREYRKSTWF